MKTILEAAKYFKARCYELESQMLGAKHLRDIYIHEAFKSGERQKTIANALNLSESTVKHIIAKRRDAK
jgi:DNA-binding NarL/FixJ family response regulator